jgi:signal transduction histidine kinase
VVACLPVPYVDHVTTAPPTSASRAGPDLSAPAAVPPGPGGDRREPGAKRSVVYDVLTAPVSPRTWEAQIHLLYDLLVGGAIFLFLVIAASLLAAVACTIVLLPVVVWLTMIAMRPIGMMERARYRATLGVRIPDPYPAFSGTLWDRVLQRLLSGAAWRELGYGIVAFPMALIGFFATISLWSLSLGLATLPFYISGLPDGIARLGSVDIHPGPGLALATAAGILGLFVSPWAARGWVALDVSMASSLLGRGVTAELEERVDVLETSRSWALEVAEAERRRIERDLHDGAQQRLVALAMELGMAREKLDSDPERARELMDKAHEDAKAAIVELRDLARGIHPPDLGGSGLPGAIPVLAGRSPVPVEVDVSVPERPAASIEGIAYFIVSECLANVAKHARATRAGVRVVQQGRWLVIEVGDDGAGGAQIGGGGSGLRGLSERVASIDGRFTVSSPEGGPTIIRAELPCAS